MACTRHFSGIAARLLLTALLIVPVSALGGDIIFTGCPSSLNGNHCDSMYFGLVAVDMQTGKPSPAMRYFLVSGPGEIDEQTGLWTFHPEEMIIDAYYRGEVVVGARHGLDVTPEEEYCRFDVSVRNVPARIEGGCGTHHTVLPGDTLALELSVTDPDWCDDPVLNIVAAIPEPVGPLVLDATVGHLVFIPDAADLGETFEVRIAPDTSSLRYRCAVYFDVFEPEPIEITLSQKEFGAVALGDTVSVDVILNGSPIPLDKVYLTMRFESSVLEFIGGRGGPDFTDSADGCHWDEFHFEALNYCVHHPYSLLRMQAQAFDQTYPPLPGCPHQDSLPAVFATLDFVVKGSLSPGDRLSPVDFYWCHCNDNMVRSDGGRVTNYASQVMGADGSEIAPAGLPGPSGALDECYLDPRLSSERTRRIIFQNGGVRFNTPFVEAPYRVRLGYHRDVLQGHFIDVPITLESIDPANGIGGFDFLIGYHASALAFQMAVEGGIYPECGWEYFTYRYDPYSGCGDACPNGLLKVVGLAEVNNGPFYAGCEGDTPGHLQPELLPIDLAYIRFLVSNDRTLEGQFLGIRFFWYDCGDNTLANYDGRDLLQSSTVFDIRQEGPVNQEDSLPTYRGAPSQCIFVDPNLGRQSIRAVDYYNGGLDIVCAGIIDARGDVNLNGLAFEIADAVMFSNYFTIGLAAFGNHLEGSIAASDADKDGVPLTIADFVFMIRVILGEVDPNQPPVSPSPNPMAVRLDTSTGVFSFTSQDSIGAVHIAVEGEIMPTLLAEDIEMKYVADSGHTNILIYSYEVGKWLSSGDLIDLSGALGIISVDAATYDGRTVQIVIDSPTDVDDDPADGALPAEHALRQNYPNPFNPETTIGYDLPHASEVRLDIFNITGQRVRTLINRRVEAGRQQIGWDGKDGSGALAPSGVYLYRLTAADFVQTRKMLLLK